MPPVDRLKPTRGRSSESSCSLMEFMREFPDDNACLEWLWRTRHSSDGETAHCPKCVTRAAFACLSQILGIGSDGADPFGEPNDAVSSPSDPRHSHAENVGRNACSAGVATDSGHRRVLSVFASGLSHTARPNPLHDLSVGVEIRGCPASLGRLLQRRDTSRLDRGTCVRVEHTFP